MDTRDKLREDGPHNGRGELLKQNFACDLHGLLNESNSHKAHPIMNKKHLRYFTSGVEPNFFREGLQTFWME